MKKFLTVIIVLVVVFSFSEVKAQISLGGGLWFASDINSVGISANGKYEINEDWAGAASFTYFLEKDYFNMSTLDFDANYNITEFENVGSLYGIGGLGVTFMSVDLGNVGGYNFGKVSDTNIGLNLGVGLNVPVNEKFIIAPELKYTISSGGYFRAGVKIMFSI